jgi:membrane-bound lytic murein transglycosylase D
LDFGHTLYAQQTPNRSQQAKTSAPSRTVFPDEYSDFDEKPRAGTASNEIVSQKLEKARQKYLRALAMIEKKDTSNATAQFESAIDILHSLANYPNIEQNEDFTDLAQSIIEDYESYIQNIDKLSENSSAFLLREKLFQEVDAFSRDHKPEITTIKTGSPAKFPIFSSTLPSLTIPLVNNEPVEKSIAFLTQDKGRKFFKRWLERSARWFPMMKRIAKEESMPEEIIYLSMIESALNPNAVSPSKAVGLWQFMRPTAMDFNLNVNMWVDERRDPEKSTHAAMRYLRYLYNEFGDWHLALAAYNCGPNGAIRRALAKAKSENSTFWDIRENLPRETRNYVPLYIATTLIALNPENYGFTKDDLQFEPEYQYEICPINEPVSMKSLAKCADLSVDELRLLNTELVSICTPPEGGAYNLRLPPGKRSIFTAHYATLTDEEKRPWIMHEVKKGETLATISTLYGASTQEIAALNQINGYRAKLKRGATLKIPIEPMGHSVAAAPLLATNESAKQSENIVVAPEPISVAQTGTVSTNTPIEKPVESVREKTPEPIISRDKSITHTVQSGESLYSISQRYGVRLTDIRNWNNISIGNDNLQLGSKLIIASTKEAIASAAGQKAIEKATSNSRATIITHKIRKGETLAQIADDYNTSIESIKNLNKLKRTSTIVAGEEIKIPASPSLLAKSSIHERVPARLAGTTVKYHRVKKGDNLSIIAALYGVKEQDVQSWNPSMKGDRIIAGEQLKVYTSNLSKGSGEAQSREISHLPKHYTVRKGDTLAEIASKFGVSVSTIRTKNKLEGKSDIRVGQTLRIQ